MGWLPAWGSTSKPEGASSTPETTSSEEYRPPGRQTRAKCWDSRDVFNECLNRNNILDAIKDKDAADKACGKESDLFEKNCASSWVSFCVFLFLNSQEKSSRHFFYDDTWTAKCHSVRRNPCKQESVSSIHCRCHVLETTRLVFYGRSIILTPTSRCSCHFAWVRLPGSRIQG